MEDKMIKDFDRAIEQMMNENAVAPPFGAWNRIAAELNTPAAAPVAARRALPVAAIGGFVAGALLIGGLVAGALIYNGNSLNNITYPSTVANSNNVSVASETTTVQPSAEVTNTIQQSSTVVAESNKPTMAVLASEAAADKQTKKDATVVAADNKLALSNNNDVAVPEVKLKASSTSIISMPYYFPAIDVANDSQTTASADADDMEEYEHDADVAKTGTKQSSEVKRRSSSSSDFRGVKFKKKKKKSFTYGSIVRAKKH